MDIKHANFTGNLVIIGFGSITTGTLPLFLRHLPITPDRITIISANADRENLAQKKGITHLQHTLTKENYESILRPHLKKGDFLVNLSVSVSSLALMDLCWQQDALYLDTSIEPWDGGYIDTVHSPSLRSNYALREKALDFGKEKGSGPTAIVGQGANPGLISGLFKQALLNLAKDNDIAANPVTREDWANLAKKLEIKVIHIAERDTQNSLQFKQQDEFVNTWSIDGFISEGLQPAELGWGSHEKHWPHCAERHAFGSDAAIFLNRPGAGTKVRSWTPSGGAYQGFLITHAESISIADFLTVYNDKNEMVYRPTVHYAYHPCDDAILSMHELAGKNWKEQSAKRFLRDEIESGADELGVLLMGNSRGAYWFGSRLCIDEARKCAPYNNATTLQVAAGVLAGVVWAIQNPDQGVVEPDYIDHKLMLEVGKPYLGQLIGAYSDWTPLQDHRGLFDDDLDHEDPWQFKNILVK